MKKLLKNKKGFTLMEMLIVVAIIVILVAISVPTFSNSLNGAKTQTDAANLRAAKVVANSQLMLSQTDTSVRKPVVGDIYDADAGAFVASGTSVTGYGQAGNNKGETITITAIDETTGAVTVAWTDVVAN